MPNASTATLTYAAILDHDHDAMVIGPGLRPGLATTEFVRLLLEVPEDPAAAPTVLDAEALRSIATLERWWEGTHRACVLTPGTRQPAGQVEVRAKAAVITGAVGVVAEVDGKTIIRTEAGLLRTAINQVVFAAATDEARPILTGVLWRFEGETVTLAAADNYRIAVKTVLFDRLTHNGWNLAF